jgi:DNA mismatch endonuclease (patch repair protein)
MADRLTQEERSALMRRVGRANTKPELAVRRALHAHGYRFRLHRKDLPGTPDIVLPRYRLAIFVHGCFWHGHQGCSKARLPTSRTGWWAEKIERNRLRDKRDEEALEKLGWTVLTIWECEIKQGIIPAIEKCLPSN